MTAGKSRLRNYDGYWILDQVGKNGLQYTSRIARLEGGL